MRRRILSIITALALCLSLCPTWAFAAEGEPDAGLCPHHREHIDCGYSASSEGQPCGYACRICPIEDLIDALPDTVTEDNADEVQAQLKEILARFSELGKDEQGQLDLSRVYELQGALDETNDPAPAEGNDAQQDGDTASVTVDGTTSYYASLKEAFTAADRQTATVTLLGNVTIADQLTLSDGNVTLDCGGFTLTSSGWYGIEVSGGTLTVKNGTLNYTGKQSAVNLNDTYSKGITLNVLSDAVIDSATKGISGDRNATVDIYGTVRGNEYSIRTYSCDLNVYPGAVISGEASGIIISGGVDQSTVNLDGGTIIGKTNAIDILSSANPTINIAGTMTAMLNDAALDSISASTGAGTLKVMCKDAHDIDNTVLDEDGCLVCDICKHQFIAVAQIEKDGQILGYAGESDLDAAFTQDGSYAGATFTLLSNVTRTIPLALQIDCTLELNGHTISYSYSYGGSSDACVIVDSNTAVTIQGEGKSEIISNKADALIVKGNATLKGGTFTSEKDYYSGVTVGGGGALSVTSSNVTIRNTGGGYGLVIAYGSAQLSAGTYSGGKAISISNSSRNGTLGGLLAHTDATRYAYFNGSTPIPGKLDATELTGTVTVGVCSHTGEGVCEYTPNENTDTHAKTCLACGQTWNAEGCTYGEYTHDDASHTQTCTACGGTKTEAHRWEYRHREYDENSRTIYKECTVCNRTEDRGTVTFPEDFTVPYGQTGDKTLAVTFNPESLEDELKNAQGSVQWYKVSPDSGKVSDSAVYTLPADLAAGEHKYNAAVDIPGCSFIVTVTVTPAPLTADMVTLDKTEVTYNGAEQKPIVAVRQGEKTLAEGTEYEVSYTRDGVAAADFTNAGTVEITVAGKGNYGGEVTKAYTIGKATPEITWSAATQELTYTGSPAAITAPAVTLAGNDSLSGIIAYSYAPQGGAAYKDGLPTDAGTYTIKAHADAEGNYTAAESTNTLTLTIHKANASLTAIPTAKTLAYTGEAQELVSAGTASFGDVVYSRTEAGGYSTAIPTGVDAGLYEVWYKIEDADNYNGVAPAKITVTIDKANYNGAKTASTSGKYGMTKTYDLTALLPEGYRLGAVSVTDADGIFEGIPTVSGATLTYTLANDAGKVDKTGTIAVSVTEATNYNPFTLTITVTVTKVRIPELTVQPISVTYTGNPVSSEQIDGSATVDGTEVAGTWSFAEGQALTNVADSGAKNVVFQPENTALYGVAYGVAAVTITKAAPSLTLTPSPAALPNGGAVTLTLSGLPEGGVASVTCSDETIIVTSGSGNTWTAEIPSGGASYTFTAAYAGGGNHEAAEASCTVSVEKLAPELVLTAAPEVLTGGGKVTLTLTGLPESEAADVTCSDAGVSVTQERGGVWTAVLPNENATYRFTASYAGSDSYHPASAACIVETKAVVILPDPPAGDNGEQFQIVMETGISEVPAEITANRPELNSPEKLETAMKTEISEVTSGIPEENTAVFDVTLMVSTDGGATWEPADQKNFPADGLTVTLPYPDGTDSGFRFTVVHMFTSTAFGKRPGETEQFTLDKVRNTPKGIQFVVTGLSPISVGWEKPETPAEPSEPSKPSKPSGGGAIHPTSGSSYAVTIEDSAHGKVSASSKYAESGDTVTLTAKPDEGYALDTLTVTDSRGNKLRLTERNGKFTFTMPARAVTVEVEFVRSSAAAPVESDGHTNCPSRAFYDLDSGEWYHEAVDFVLESGVMSGTNNGFAPSALLSRAMLAQILWSHAGKPSAAEMGAFSDVPANEWFSEAVGWAASAGIVSGYTDGRFGPSDNVTREQFAVMLWRCAGSPAGDAALNFRDAEQISSYALEALQWAVGEGVLGGKSGNRLDPQGAATRAEAAQMLYRFMK